MQIANDRLKDVSYNAARAIGPVIIPKVIVLHDTASRLDKFNAANYLQNNSRKVSVHFVVERDGTITQQVPCNRRANHAGISHYHGRNGVNNFSIGIELVNPGRMTRQGGDEEAARGWFGEVFDISAYGIQKKKTPEHGSGYWMPYTAAQIDAVLEICTACFDKYPSLKDITTHWYISPGRKIDPNPLFPLEHVRARILGREEPAEILANQPDNHYFSDNSTVTINAPGSRLNMRRWPSFNPNVIASIPHGTDVPVISQGTFDGRIWRKVIFDGQQGWVVASYTLKS